MILLKLIESSIPPVISDDRAEYVAGASVPGTTVKRLPGIRIAFYGTATAGEIFNLAILISETGQTLSWN